MSKYLWLRIAWTRTTIISLTQKRMTFNKYITCATCEVENFVMGAQLLMHFIPVVKSATKHQHEEISSNIRRLEGNSKHIIASKLLISQHNFVGEPETLCGNWLFVLLKCFRWNWLNRKWATDDDALHLTLRFDSRKRRQQPRKMQIAHVSLTTSAKAC